MELEYRSKTNHTSEISGWCTLELTERGGGRWDYREAKELGDALEYLEIRVKPDFIPGYYQCTEEGLHFGIGEILWMGSQADIDHTKCGWSRVNVTLAE
jgi:hypothetical protein